MMLLVCFDLPRYTSKDRKQATKYQRRLVELGFTMKQYSLYEREIRSPETRDKVIATLANEIPDAGAIICYVLPDEVNDKQVQILGEKAVLYTIRKPQFIVL